MEMKILYIEDESVLGKLVAEALEKQGYEVLWVKSGAEGLASFRKFVPHVCLLDIMLPGVDGYTLAEQIRALDKKIPLLFLTAKTSIADLTKGFHAGCNDYIRKPFNMEELLLRVANWVTVCYGAQEQTIGAINISSFVFDVQTQQLSSADVTTRLSHKEAQLLSVLVQHKNAIVSREHVLQQVWGDTSIYHSRILDVYITRLRKYFKPDRRIDIITLRGIGYRFII